MSEQAYSLLSVLGILWATIQIVTGAAKSLNDRRDAYLAGRNSLSPGHLAAIRRDWVHALRGYVALAVVTLVALICWSIADSSIRPYWPLLCGVGLIPIATVLILLPSASRDRALLDGDARLGAALAEFRQEASVRRRGRVKVCVPQLAKNQRVEVVVRLLRYDDAQEI